MDVCTEVSIVTKVNRYHNGTNLGSIYVLEKWLTGSMFPKFAGGSEFDAVKASISASGLDATRAKWERHWSKAVSEEDWKWLEEAAHCKSFPFRSKQ